MIRTIALAALAAALTWPAVAGAACTGADPAITSVSVAGVTPEGGVDHYHITGTVVNRGNQAQASSVLQFVDIVQNGQRLDSKSIPPLTVGRSYVFSYDALRSTGAGKGTTTLHFRIRMRSPSAPGGANCTADDDQNSLTF